MHQVPCSLQGGPRRYTSGTLVPDSEPPRDSALLGQGPLPDSEVPSCIHSSDAADGGLDSLEQMRDEADPYSVTISGESRYDRADGA